jgi:hypothetical protein
MTTPTPADRLALAVCASLILEDQGLCRHICVDCRRISEAHARELAAILRERHGSSTTADWLEAIGKHPPTMEAP